MVVQIGAVMRWNIGVGAGFPGREEASIAGLDSDDKKFAGVDDKRKLEKSNGKFRFEFNRRLLLIGIEGVAFVY